jgi:hypothetical protein
MKMIALRMASENLPENLIGECALFGDSLYKICSLVGHHPVPFSHYKTP